MLQYEVADCLTRIKNGYAVGKKTVSVRKTKLNIQILAVMQSKGSIEGVSMNEEDPFHMNVQLGYSKGRAVMRDVKVHSRPAIRRYYKASKIPLFKSGLSYGIITTSKGLMTTHQAKKDGVGGELICVVE